MIETNKCPRCGRPLADDAPDGICPSCLIMAGLADDHSPAIAATTPQSAPFVPPAAAEIAPHFPQVEVLEVLGHGGMGTVYKARQTKLDRLVALKIIRSESAEDAAFAERFNREARTLARLSHPNIVGVHDFGEVATDSGTLYYFLMEYVDGPNLRQLVQAGDLQADQALAIIPQICEALQFAHAEGVVHRDIKPENILVDRKGRVKIADFGLAKLAERSADSFTLTGTHQVMGTPRYMAPEQMEGSREVDHRADIYSLGVVFYELLTGELPMGQFEPPSARAGTDARLDDVVLRALAREPERRYQSAGELKSQVDAISSVQSQASFAKAQPQPEYRAGASTIIEREALAAWRWLGVDSGSSAESQKPEPPALLMTLISLAGCLVVLLPWIDVQVTDPGEPVGPPTVAKVETQSDYSLCLFQDAEAGWAEGRAPESVITDLQHTFYGTEKWPGITCCVCFALITLLLLALPGASRRKVRWLLPMTILSGVALVHTFLFRTEVEASRFVLPQPRLAEESVRGSHLVSVGQAEYLFCQDASGDFFNGEPLRSLPHQLTYRSGYYCSMGLAIAMLVFSATGIRHSLAGRETTDPKHRRGSKGPPIARHQFILSSVDDLDGQLKFYFSSHGYALVSQSEGSWQFHRGQAIADYPSGDIRGFEMTVRVKVNSDPARGVTVVCLWEAHTMWARAYGLDPGVLEQEGRELEALLRGGSGAAVGDIQQPVAGLAAGGFTATPAPAGAPASGTHLSSETSSRQKEQTTEADEAAVQAAKIELEGASLGLSVIGGLALMGHIGFLIYQASHHITDDEATLICIPILPAIVMIIGGISASNIGSRKLCLAGAIAALLLFSPLWVIAAPTGAFALNLLGRSHVRRGFEASRRLRRKDELTGPPRFSRKAIFGALLIPLSIVMAAAYTMTSTVNTSRGASAKDYPTGSTPTFVLLIVTGVVLIPPAVTTILGMIALSDIRHSAGRLRGLGLAFLDAVLFPTLVANAVAVGFLSQVIAAIAPALDGMISLLGIALLIVLPVNIIVLRSAWRRLSAPVGDAF